MNICRSVLWFYYPTPASDLSYKLHLDMRISLELLDDSFVRRVSIYTNSGHLPKYESSQHSQRETSRHTVFNRGGKRISISTNSR